MNYDYDELTPQVVRRVGFRERYRGYDPSDVDPLLEELARRVETLHEELEALAADAAPSPGEPVGPAVEDVAALAAMLHIGLAARDARNIVVAARKKTGLTRAIPERDIVNQERARALLYRPTSVD